MFDYKQNYLRKCLFSVEQTENYKLTLMNKFRSTRFKVYIKQR